MFYIGIYRENVKKSSCLKPQGQELIFGIKHHQVDLYQVCSNNDPGVKNGPAPGHMFYIGLYREDKTSPS